ncbi:PREDICTED: putative ferric-chelate reductase 1 [Branchiostoma belcheri]|uniref:Ferric-chelate reductase 1 n=1 Tax=Branchiostoma belcheri TaxID=7741 RepID=A0A6P4Z0U1_BRABE|nr:PREDICTED: putative ferric-chelate reductase 1 [Branchiostoma belcheri]
MWCFVWLVLLCGVGDRVQGYGNGAPLEACVTMTPGHFGTTAQTSPTPYSLVAPAQYVPGQSITVQITGADFQGFLIQARKVGTTTSVGFFTDPPSNVRTNDCPNTVARGANTATHNSQATKRDLSLTWTPPSEAGHGTVEFVATVAEQKTVYWTDLKSSQLTETTAAAATTQQVTTPARTTPLRTTPRQQATTTQPTTEPAVERVMLGTVSGWMFYKVQASGPMTNANVKSACDSVGLSLPCYINRDDCSEAPYWNSDCILINSTCRQTQRIVSEAICGGSGPASCEAMNNVFAYMPGWQADGSACGVATTTNTWCTRGASYFSLYAFCAGTGNVGSAVTLNSDLLWVILPACISRMVML